MRFLSQPASSMRTMIWVSRFSNTRGGREEVGGADLAPVLDDGLRALGAAHAHGGGVGLAVGEDVIADPGHRQVGEQDVVGVEAVELVAVLRRDDDVLVREHHALGPAGGAGGVEHDADVAALALGDLVEPPALGAGVGLHLLAAELLDVLEGVQVGRIVVGEAALLVVDDALRASSAGRRSEMTLSTCSWSWTTANFTSACSST